MHLHYQRLLSCFFFHPKSPQGAQLGVAVVAAALMDAHLLFTNMTGYILHSQKPQWNGSTGKNIYIFLGQALIIWSQRTLNMHAYVR